MQKKYCIMHPFTAYSSSDITTVLILCRERLNEKKEEYVNVGSHSSCKNASIYVPENAVRNVTKFNKVN